MPLPGYKSYIVGTLIAANAFAEAMGWITPEAADAVYGFLVGGGIISLRDAIAKK